MRVTVRGSTDLTALLRRAGRGDVAAAATVYDSTIDDAWRIAVATVGCEKRAAEVVETAYAQVWGADGADDGTGDGTARTRSWVLAVVYLLSRDAGARAA